MLEALPRRTFLRTAFLTSGPAHGLLDHGLLRTAFLTAAFFARLFLTTPLAHGLLGHGLARGLLRGGLLCGLFLGGGFLRRLLSSSFRHVLRPSSFACFAREFFALCRNASEGTFVLIRRKSSTTAKQLRRPDDYRIIARVSTSLRRVLRPSKRTTRAHAAMSSSIAALTRPSRCFGRAATSPSRLDFRASPRIDACCKEGASHAPAPRATSESPLIAQADEPRTRVKSKRRARASQSNFSWDKRVAFSLRHARICNVSLA